MKKVLLLAVFFLSLYAANASHIVGAELYYNCTGNNNYHITLKLYRDCNCVNCAQYGDPEYVTIFDGSGGIYTQVAMPLPPVTQLQPTFTNPCLQEPNVCIEEADYTGDIMLPPAVGGYTIVYQRCCRNNGVMNLVANQGATYTAEVPGSALATCNNSARFNSLPPMFICLNAPLNIDYSANDPDGDSLVYSLCDPYSGADGNCPDPSPNGGQNGCATAPPSPPYTAALFNAPYTAANFTNSTATVSDLTIDPQTGLLTGTPNTAGLFDITVCVSEYRNGHLLNTLRRDFQFTVTQCNIPIAAVPDVAINHGIGVYTIDCKSLTVNFTNTSYNPGTTPLAYFWDFGVPGSTTDTSSLSAPTFTYPDTGSYLVHLVASNTGQNGQLCSDTTTAYVYVYPTFNAAFTVPAAICGDSAVKFLDQTVSTSGLTNVWTWSFGDGAGSNQPNPSHIYATPGTYTARLVDQNVLGCKDTSTHIITVYPMPVAVFADTNFCFSQPVAFTNNSTGSIAAYNWNFGDGANSTSTQTAPTYTYSAPGNYTATLIVSSSHGCKDTATGNIVIHPLPVVTTSGDVTICPFASTQLIATGGGTYLWAPATGLSDSSSATPIAAPPPPNSQVYTVTVTSQFLCTSQGSLRVSFFPVPHAYAGLDTSVCLNPVSFHDSVQLNPTGGVSYQWSPATGLSNPNIANPLAKPSSNTTYTVTSTDANGCTATDSVTVYVLDPALNLIVQDTVVICQFDTAFPTIINQGASGYGWSPTLFMTNPTSFNTGFYPPTTSTYVLTVTNYCYLKSDSIVIYVDSIPQLGLPAVDSICIGNSYQFNAQNAVVYQWNPNPTLSSTTIANPVATPTVSTKYIVTGINQNGCVNKDSTLILVYEPSPIRIYPQDTPFICQGTSAPLRAVGAYTYVWSPAASLNSPNIANPLATPLDTTQYNVVATNIHGCKSYDSLVIKVQKPVVASAPTPFVACEGIPVQLHASGGPFFSWSPTGSLNDTVTNDPFALPDSTTFYIVKVFNDCFSDTAGVEVDIHPLPIVDAGPDTTIWRDTHAELHGTTNAPTYFWDASTWLENASMLSTSASPPFTTAYYLFGIDQYGCQNKDSVLITVVPHTELLIPTGFSPNGDGVNDEFKVVRSLNIDKLIEFAVFDRWGEKIFSTDNIDEGWDGTHQGRPSPLGVYVWMVMAETKDGQQITKKGNVTLLR